MSDDTQLIIPHAGSDPHPATLSRRVLLHRAARGLAAIPALLGLRTPPAAAMPATNTFVLAQLQYRGGQWDPRPLAVAPLIAGNAPANQRRDPKRAPYPHPARPGAVFPPLPVHDRRAGFRALRHRGVGNSAPLPALRRLNAHRRRTRQQGAGLRRQRAARNRPPVPGPRAQNPGARSFRLSHLLPYPYHGRRAHRQSLPRRRAHRRPHPAAILPERPRRRLGSATTSAAGCPPATQAAKSNACKPSSSASTPSCTPSPSTTNRTSSTSPSSAGSLAEALLPPPSACLDVPFVQEFPLACVSRLSGFPLGLWMGASPTHRRQPCNLTTQKSSPSSPASARKALYSRASNHRLRRPGISGFRHDRGGDSGGFPDLTHEDIRACLAFAADRERRMVSIPPA